MSDKVQATVRRQLVTCHRCGHSCGIAVWIPHEWTLSDGRTTTGGTRPAALCPTCDLSDSRASALAMFLRFHDGFRGNDAIEPEVIGQLTTLLQAWLPYAAVPVVNDDAFNADVAAWRAGEFD